jgi:tetratricopeptide (TPR) repeat protein
VVKQLAHQAESDDSLDPYLERLAYHFELTSSLVSELGPVAGLPDDLAAQGVRFLERAAARAETRENWPVVVRYVTHALAMCSHHDDPAQRLRLHLTRAQALAELRETARARADVAAAQRLADELGDEHCAAAALTILGDIEFREGDLDGSAQSLARAVELWRALDDTAGSADALRRAAMTALFANRLEQAASLAEEALGLFRQAGDRRGEAWALQNRAWIAFLRGDHAVAEARIEESVTTFGDIGDWGGVGWALGLLAWIRFAQGRLDEAARLAHQTLEEAAELGNRWAVAMMNVLVAALAVWQGADEKAIGHATEARTIFRELGDRWGETQALGPHLIALDALGRLDAADAILAEMREVAPANSDLLSVPDLMATTILTRRGDVRNLDLTQPALTVSDAGLPRDMIRNEQHATLALALLQRGRVEEALEPAHLGFGGATERGDRASTGAVLALTLVAADRPVEAIELVDRLADLAVTYVDRYRLGLARAFASARLGDRDAAEAALAEAGAVVDATEARLDQLVVRTARAALWRAFEREEAPVAEADAHMRAEDIGLDPVGWRALFARMTGGPIPAGTAQAG